MKVYRLFWKSQQIGEFEETSMDMAYMDGNFTSNNSELAKKFIDKCLLFDLRTVMLDPTKGIRAILKTDDSFEMNVLVLGISVKNELSLRWINGKKENIDWFVANVPEE